MLYGTVLTVHSTAMAMAFCMLVASEVLFVPARPGPLKIAFLTNRIGGILMGVGVVAGIGLVFVGGWSLLTPWLVASLVLIAVMMAVEGKYVRSWEQETRSALREMVAADKIRISVRQRRALIGRLAIIALFAIVALLMVTKPDMVLAR